MRAIRRGALVAMIAAGIAACGGGSPIQDAENCTELAQIVAENSGIDEEAVNERAVELGGEALARGAEGEAFLCSSIAGEEVSDRIAEDFDRIADELGGEG